MGALDVHRALLARDVAHEVVRLRRPVAGADDLPAALDLPPAQCVAVRCYVADGGVVVVLVAARAVPDPVTLLDVLGARSLRAATPGEVNAATDCAAELVSPVGLPLALPVLADCWLAAADVVYTAAAESGVALGIRAADLLAVTGARLVPLSGRPLGPVGQVHWDGVLDLDAAAAPVAVPAAADEPGLAPVVDLDLRVRGRRGAG